LKEAIKPGNKNIFLILIHIHFCIAVPDSAVQGAQIVNATKTVRQMLSGVGGGVHWSSLRVSCGKFPFCWSFPSKYDEHLL